MPSASLTRRGPAVALALLIVAVTVGTLVYPTYPNYDSYYSLIWGRELLHAHLPTFDVYRAPTEHPLALVFGAALSLLGRSGDRVMVLATMASLVVLFLASLMRPEAWLIAGFYVLWAGWRAPRPDRLRFAAIAAAGPLVWVAVDTVVTGHPLFSLTHTNGLAEELGRNKGLSQVP